MITYFKDKNNKSKKNYRKYKTKTTIIKSFGTFSFIAKTSSSVTLSLTVIGQIAIPISTAIACGLSIGNKKIYEIIINKYNKNKEQYQKDQESIDSSDKLYRKSLQDIVIDKNENDSLCKILLNTWKK